MTCYSIGFYTDEHKDTLRVLATLNNSDYQITSGTFDILAASVRKNFQSLHPDQDIVILERQDTDDYAIL